MRHQQRQNIAIAFTDAPPEAVRLRLGAAADRTSLDLALIIVATALNEPAAHPVLVVV